ncbi:hypothetical protein ASF88_12215 [Leifsonia sp. Leaf336]|nr:hypothetical protein ASF88_12215 [Leifsonia sp. Leaf336]
MLYASAFLQKPQVPGEMIMITAEDLNGLMATIKGMDWANGLTLLLHTPGGVTMAAQTMVEYLRSKFDDIEVIVPTFAMSAGTMISLAADRIVMGNHSQLGPIDPQLAINGRQFSAKSIVDQFKKAHDEILANPVAAHVWAPILASQGPSLLQYAEDQLAFSEQMVSEWLAKYMMARAVDPAAEGKRIAAFFNDASNHKSHDKRIGIEEATASGVVVEKLEDDQALQEAVLTLYHVVTILIEQSAITKVISSTTGQSWLKSWTGSQT